MNAHRVPIAERLIPSQRRLLPGCQRGKDRLTKRLLGPVRAMSASRSGGVNTEGSVRMLVAPWVIGTRSSAAEPPSHPSPRTTPSLRPRSMPEFSGLPAHATAPAAQFPPPRAVFGRWNAQNRSQIALNAFSVGQAARRSPWGGWRSYSASSLQIDRALHSPPEPSRATNRFPARVGPRLLEAPTGYA